MNILHGILFVFLISWPLSILAADNRIEHHLLTVDIDPVANSLSAVDVIDIQGDGPELLLYLGVDGNHYDHWYLKGSWAFWDLEALVGRKALLATFRDLVRKYGGTVISATEFRTTLERSLDMDPNRWFRRWFYESGFQPLYRVDSVEDEEQ